MFTDLYLIAGSTSRTFARPKFGHARENTLLTSKWSHASSALLTTIFSCLIVSQVKTTTLWFCVAQYKFKTESDSNPPD